MFSMYIIVSGSTSTEDGVEGNDRLVKEDQALVGFTF